MCSRAKKPPSICIVTVNWKSFEHTKRFVETVKSCRYSGAHLVIVNNDPEAKDSVNSLTGAKTAILQNDRNVGYAEALNQGIRFALESTNADFLLLMNNDTSFEPDFLDELAKNRDRSTIFSPVILFEGTDIIQNTGGRLSLLIGGACSVNRRVKFDRLRQESPDFLSGCCMYLHRNVIDRTGFFDRRYHSYCEDVDYSFRARESGISLKIIWDLKIWHHHSASTRKEPGRKVLLLSRNTIVLAREHIPRPGRWLFIAACVARGFLQNAGKDTFRDYLRGTKDGLSS